MATIIDVSEVLLDLGLSASVTDAERAVVLAAIVKAEGAVKRHLKYDPVQRERTEFYPMRDYGRRTGEGVWESQGGQAYLRRPATAASSELQVQHLPVRAEPAIDLRIDHGARSGTASGAFADETLKVEGTDFWPNYDGEDSGGDALCRDGIIRSFGQWPSSPGSVRIVYTAGYTPEELHGQDAIVDASPIMDAVIDEAVRRARKAFALMKQGRTGFVAGALKSEKLGDYAYTVDTAVMDRMVGGSWDILPETEQKLQDFVNIGWPLAS